MSYEGHKGQIRRELSLPGRAEECLPATAVLRGERASAVKAAGTPDTARVPPQSEASLASTNAGNALTLQEAIQLTAKPTVLASVRK